MVTIDGHFRDLKSIADPRRPALAGIGVIVCFFTIFAFWSWSAPLSGAAVAEGNLQVQGQRQSVQHPYGGVVEQLLVKQGDKVVKGQLLVRLSDADPRSKLDVLLADQVNRLAAEGRLIAERDKLPNPVFPEELNARLNERGVKQAMSNERAMMTARQHQHDAQLGTTEQKIAQLREQIKGSQAQLDGAEKQRSLLGEETDGARQLLAAGYTPKTRVLALERNIAQLESEKGARAAEIASAQQAIGEAQLERAKIERDRIAEITDQIRSTEAALAELSPKIDAARDVLSRTNILAPATGSVVDLSVFTEGGVVQPGAKILDIIPSVDPLLVEARLKLSDINDVAVGQQAQIQLTGITRNERPNIRGQVITVAADRSTDQRTGASYYAVQIRPAPEDIAKVRIELQAGMPAEAMITTRPRTLLDYLVSPLIDEIVGAFREK